MREDSKELRFLRRHRPRLHLDQIRPHGLAARMYSTGTRHAKHTKAQFVVFRLRGSRPRTVRRRSPAASCRGWVAGWVKKGARGNSRKSWAIGNSRIGRTPPPPRISCCFITTFSRRAGPPPVVRCSPMDPRDAARQESILLRDSRRLTGLNLLSSRPGAVLDADFAGLQPADAAALIGAWRRQARRMLDA